MTLHARESRLAAMASAVPSKTNVSRGQVVGYAGDTGWSTACHLHFTVLANGQPVNPMNYM